MASLHDLLQHKLIEVGDKIEFTFKGNHFTCSILRGGLLSDCYLQKVHESSPVRVLEHTVAFSSLTAWTEACLQDVLEEYYTRYSSWKRVYHVRTRRSMGDIRDQYKISKEIKADNVVELHKEILRLQQTIEEMNAYIRTLNTDMPCKQWSFMSVAEAVVEPETKNESPTHVDETLHNRAQEFFCFSDSLHV